MSSPNLQGQPPNLQPDGVALICQLCSDSHGNLISCPNCKKCYHEHCVGAAIADRNNWRCARCVEAGEQVTTAAAGVSRRNSTRSTTSQRQLDLELQKLTEEHELMKRLTQDFLRRKYELLQQDTEVNEAANVDRLSLPINDTVLSSTRIHSLPTMLPFSTTPLVSDNLHTRPRANNIDGETNNNNDYVNAANTDNHVPRSSLISQLRPDGMLINISGSPLPQNFLDFATNGTQNNSLTSVATALPQQSPKLTTAQLNARHSVPKDLPSFSGKAEEWPLVCSTYDWSTSICGLTDAENLIRLQKALKGDALRSVQHILIHPSCIPAALSTLKLLYGQPDKILASLRRKLKDLPCVNQNKLESFTEFAVALKGFQATLEASNLQEELNNSTLLDDLVTKLPPYFQLLWGSHKLILMQKGKRATLCDFTGWIFEYGLSASLTVQEAKTDMHASHKSRPVNIHTERALCPICDQTCQSVAKCNMFLKSDRNNRWDLVRKNNLCKKCLQQQKSKQFCKCTLTCSVMNCAAKHHPLLHNHQKKHNHERVDEHSHPEAATKAGKGNCNAHQDYNDKNENVLFKIIPVIISSVDKSIRTFAFIDEGSSISLMENSLAAELNLHGRNEPLCLKWTGNMRRREENSQLLSITIAGRNKNSFSIDVHTVEHLSLPKQTVNYGKLCEQYAHLKGIPVEDYQDASPKILIGINNCALSTPLKIREGGQQEPVGIKTRLGWLIYGKINDSASQMNSYNYHICECSYDKELHDMMKEYFTIDSIGIKAVSSLKTSKDDERALTILSQQILQRQDGHYEVGLLWKYDDFDLPDSLGMAMRRLKCLETRLRKDPALLSTFRNMIKDYLEKGYIRKLNNMEIRDTSRRTWYLPTFAVFNPNKPKKTRIVWDAAAKVNGTSLNSMLLKGPDLLASLPAILHRFRQRPVAFCADIQEMFHQIFIKETDQHVQRFLWRDCEENKNPTVYVMNVMIFGAACAPSISQFVKNFNADKFDDKYPDAVRAVKENHYMDDYLDSVDEVQGAVRLAKEVEAIHRNGGFRIRNWLCNEKQFLHELKQTNENAMKSLSPSTGELEKVLGIFWIPSTDVLAFKISDRLLNDETVCSDQIPTKRQLLKILMSIYDPLGIIGHYLMYLKMLLQEVWRSSIGWDEKLQPNEYEKWRIWLKYLPKLQDVRIPRCYLNTFKNYKDLGVELHTFVDASANGYAAVSYLRLSLHNKIECALIGSKTRVAPLKITSIPRLELMAALIGARYAKSIAESHSIQIRRKIFWTDSKTVLSWLCSDPHKFNQFVAFRISEITEISNTNEWRWIPSNLNVADDATKWKKKPDLAVNSRWFIGPTFLHQSEEEWPNDEVRAEKTKEEIKKFMLFTTKASFPFEFERFSKWQRLLRTAAYVLRYIENLKRKRVKNPLVTGELHQDEICRAETLLFKQSQHEFYNEELLALQKENEVSKSSSLYKLSPFIDENGVICIQGRAQLANIPIEQKNPIILPNNSRLVTLLLMHYHSKFHHMCHENVVNEIRQKIHVSRLRTRLRQVARNCQKCKISNAAPLCPRMANLPLARTASHVLPFTFCGIDYFGPMVVSVNRHLEKRYGVLFTCLSIRAVHIEIAHSLTTDSCVIAIRNFMARRGIPREIFSDNATNFVGSERQLREAVDLIDKNILIREFTTSITKWNFIPPASPHMGGAWERLVRSVKTVLYSIMPMRNPNDELLRAMLCEVENIINSRPLTYMPVDNNNEEAITPNHLLLGSSSGMKPLIEINDDAILLKHSWRSAQKFANRFWQRWLGEYLPTLTCRTKWHKAVKPLQAGDLVYVVDPKFPTNVWLRGKVVEAKAAQDGQTRHAKVQTKYGILERPTTKLAVLEVAEKGE